MGSEENLILCQSEMHDETNQECTVNIKVVHTFSLIKLLFSPDGFSTGIGRDILPRSQLLVFLIGRPPPRRETTQANAG